MHVFATTTAAQVLELGQKAGVIETASPWSSRLTGAAKKASD
jgi:hypothetical protein